MTREEIVNDIINTLFECTHNGEDDTISDKEFAEVLADKFIKHEADLLKEFIEWLKNVLKQDHDDKAWMMNHTEEQEIEDRYYYRGQCTAIRRLITLLDGDLEEFLEKNEDVQNDEVGRTI